MTLPVIKDRRSNKALRDTSRQFRLVDKNTKTWIAMLQNIRKTAVPNYILRVKPVTTRPRKIRNFLNMVLTQKNQSQTMSYPVSNGNDKKNAFSQPRNEPKRPLRHTLAGTLLLPCLKTRLVSQVNRDVNHPKLNAETPFLNDPDRHPPSDDLPPQNLRHLPRDGRGPEVELV